VSFLAYLHSFDYDWLFIGERYTDMYPCTNDERWIWGFGCSWVWDFDLMILSYLIGCDRVRFGNLCLGWASYLIASVAYSTTTTTVMALCARICENLRFSGLLMMFSISLRSSLHASAPRRTLRNGLLFCFILSDLSRAPL